MNLPLNIKKWLNDRGISDAVLEHNNIGFENDHIVIPIFKNGVFLFNKYRRSPFILEGPKYKYEKGATSELFNFGNTMWPTEQVVVCEGELDAMRLQSAGYYAISTTGGSGTFKDEWGALLKDNEAYLCYDNDDPGILGTIRALEVLPHARVIEIPRESGVKDVSDYLLKHETREFVDLFGMAKKWLLPTAASEGKQGQKNYATQLRFTGEKLAIVARERRANNQPTEFVDALIVHVQKLFAEANRKAKYTRPKSIETDDLKKARAVPITEYVKFDRRGYACCIAHAEKTPSMFYYRTKNRVHCFSCAFNGDTIDVVQKLFGLSVGGAIKKINGV